MECICGGKDSVIVLPTAGGKSLEHYQLESGRAGRDGLEAECCLYYSRSDYLTWKRILEASEPQMMGMSAAKLRQMFRYCTGVSCRHRAILQYFGQNLDKENCEACDIGLMKKLEQYGEHILQVMRRYSAGEQY